MNDHADTLRNLRVGVEMDAAHDPEGAAKLKALDAAIAALEAGRSGEAGWVSRAAWCAESILANVLPDVESQRCEGGNEVRHLCWMAEELAASRVTSETKACRWLGYLQGGLVFLGLSTLDAEKDRNLASSAAAPQQPPPDRSLETSRRQAAVELLLSQGYRWEGGSWTGQPPPAGLASPVGVTDEWNEDALAAVIQQEAAPSVSCPSAWLHTVVQDDGDEDQALSFAPDSFPLQGVGGFRSIKAVPLYAAAPVWMGVDLAGGPDETVEMEWPPVEGGQPAASELVIRLKEQPQRRPGVYAGPSGITYVGAVFESNESPAPWGFLPAGAASAHGGRPMTLRECAEAEQPAASEDGLLPCPCCNAPAMVSGEWQDCDGNWAVECSACNVLSWTPEDWNRRLTTTGQGDVERLVHATRSLCRHYVNTLESANDRITSLGGDCDPVDVMERRDPVLKVAREALAPFGQQQEGQG